MPSDVINGLPVEGFQCRDRNETAVPCRFPLDSCISMNTGNLLVNQWLMTKYPEIVHRNEQLDDRNPFEPIMIEGELNME